GLLHAAARFAAPLLVCDDQGFFVQHGGLDTWPGAHIDAYLLPHETAQPEGGESEHRHGAVSDGGRVPGEKCTEKRGRVGEVEYPGPAGDEADRQIDCPFDGSARDLGRLPWRLVEPHPGIAIAIDEPVDMLEQIGPYGLRAG